MKVFLALLAGASLAALPIATVGAADPPPAPCHGIAIKDATGDQVIGPVNGNFPLGGTPVTSKGPDNLDIKGVFFNTVKGVTTANIQVANLTQTVPAEFREGRFSYIVDFKDVGDVAFARAEVSASGVTFHLTKVQSVGGVLTANIGNQDIKGQFFPGPDGVVSIELPPDVFKPGLVLENVLANVSQRTDNNLYAGYLNDQAPDDGATSAKKVTLAECPAGGGGGGDGGGTSTTPPADPAPTPAPAPNPPTGAVEQPAPSNSQPSSSPPPGTLPASGSLKVEVAVDKGKRKTAVRRGLRARVRCSVQCKVGAVARIDKKTARKLKLGRKAMKIGTGKASITKAGRIPFFVKMTKKAKKALKRKNVKKFALKVQFFVTDNEGNQLKKVTKKSTLR